MDISKILDTIKFMMDISDDDDSFDNSLLVHINSAISALTQLGVPKPTPNFKVDKNTTWDTYTQNPDLESIKSYIYIKTLMVFDGANIKPAHQKACEQTLAEYEYRIRVAVDLAQPETPPTTEHDTDEN